METVLYAFEANYHVWCYAIKASAAIHRYNNESDKRRLDVTSYLESLDQAAQATRHRQILNGSEITAREMPLTRHFR